MHNEVPVESGIDVVVPDDVGLLRDPTIPFDVTTVTTADNARLHVRSFGPADAPPIVLIHGFACRIEYWNPQINHFARDHRVIVYDQRGFGRSTIGTAELRPRLLGEDLAAVLAATVSTDNPAVVVGHSFGGITIMAWAQHHPEQVADYARAVLLADTIAQRFAASTELLPFADRFALVRRPLLRAISRTSLPLPSGSVLRRVLRDVAMTPAADAATAEFLLTMIAPVPPRTRARWAAGLTRLDVRNGLDHLTVPTTVLVGARDRVTPPAGARLIREALARHGSLHRYVVLPDIGHCSNIEAPTVFDAEISALLTLPRD